MARSSGQLCTRKWECEIGQKKAHIHGIQINDGSVEKKVEFVTGLFEQKVKVADICSQDERNDIIASTKCKGFNGVATHGVITRLAQKSHCGHRENGFRRNILSGPEQKTDSVVTVNLVSESRRTH